MAKYVLPFYLEAFISLHYTPLVKLKPFICDSFVGCYIWMLLFERAAKISRFRMYIYCMLFLLWNTKYLITSLTLSARGSSLYVKIWRLQIMTYRNVPRTERNSLFYNGRRPQHRYIQMNRKELTKTFMMISNWKITLVSMAYAIIFQRFKD